MTARRRPPRTTARRCAVCGGPADDGDDYVLTLGKRRRPCCESCWVELYPTFCPPPRHTHRRKDYTGD